MSYGSEGTFFSAVPARSSRRILRTATRVAGKPGSVKRSVRSGKPSRRHDGAGQKNLDANPKQDENGWK